MTIATPKGRGKGNRFLDDVCEADVLIHIVDGSGNMDEQGHSNGGGDPVSDIEWIYAEIHRWIADNVWAKWSTVSRLFPWLDFSFRFGSILM